MRGRTPTPTALKILRGNPGKRRIDQLTEPQPVIGLGAPPVHLDDEAKRYWMSQGPQLVKLGTLGESDAGLFAMLCECHSREVWYGAQIDTLRQRKKLAPREERRLDRMESLRLKNAAQFQKIGGEFGIGAASRTRIKVQPNDGQLELPGVSDGPLARILGRREA